MQDHTAIKRHTDANEDPVYGELYSSTVREIRIISERRSKSDNAYMAFGCRDDLRFSIEELSEMCMCMGVAYASSLIAYRRDGKKWTIDGVPPSGAAGLVLLSAIDGLREELSLQERSILSLLQNYRTPLSAKKSVAVLCLSLDAVSLRNLMDFRMYAGVWNRSCDPKGDAQLVAEAHLE